MFVKLTYKIDDKNYEDVSEYKDQGTGKDLDIDLLDKAVTKRLIELTNAKFDILTEEPNVE